MKKMSFTLSKSSAEDTDDMAARMMTTEFVMAMRGEDPRYELSKHDRGIGGENGRKVSFHLIYIVAGMLP